MQSVITPLGLTAEISPHHGGGSDWVSDGEEGAADPRRPVCVRSSIVVIRDLGVSWDRLSPCKRAKTRFVLKAGFENRSTIPERGCPKNSPRQSGTRDLHLQIKVDAEVVHVDLGLDEGIGALAAIIRSAPSWDEQCMNSL